MDGLRKKRGRLANECAPMVPEQCVQPLFILVLTLSLPALVFHLLVLELFEGQHGPGKSYLVNRSGFNNRAVVVTRPA